MASVKDTGKNIATHTKQYMATLQHDQFPKFARFAKTTARSIRIVAKGAAIGAKEAKRALGAKREVEEAGRNAADAAKDYAKRAGSTVAEAGTEARSMLRSERKPETEKTEKRGQEGAQERTAAEKAEEPGQEGAPRKTAPPPGEGGQRAIGEALQGAAASARGEIEKGRTNIQEGATRTAEAARDAGANIKEQLGGAKTQPTATREGQRKPESRAATEANPPAAGGYLGMTTFPVDLPEKLSKEHSTRRGLIVLGVEPGGPADEAGVQMGDTLLTLDDDPLCEIQDLVAHLPPDRIGQEVHAKVLRAGAALDIALRVGSKQPSSSSQPAASESEAHPG